MAEGTHFAPAARAEPEHLEEQIRFVGESSLVSGLLNTVCGLLAVLNEEDRSSPERFIHETAGYRRSSLGFGAAR